MSQIYTGRSRNTSRSAYHKKDTNAPQSTRYPRFLRLLAKQSAAAILCGLLVLGMHNGPVLRLRQYTDALHQALQYESDLSGLRQTGTDLFKWLQNRFSSSEPTPSTTTAPAVTDLNPEAVTTH